MTQLGQVRFALATAPVLMLDRPDGAAIIERIRKESGFSQNQLARMAGVDPAYINRIERRLGHHRPSRAVVCRLIEALGLDLDEGDRLLYAFGYAGRVDWQMAWEQAVAGLPPAVEAAVARTLASILATAAAGLPPAVEAAVARTLASILATAVAVPNPDDAP